MGLGLPIFLFVLFLLIRSLAKRTVGLYLSDFEVLGKDSEGTTIHKLTLPEGLDKKTIEGWGREWTDTKRDMDKNRRILVRLPRALVSKLEVEHADSSGSKVVDLSSPISPLLGELRRWSPALPQKKILVTNFEVGILEPRLRLALLEALERVRAEVPVILCSSVSPLHHLVTPDAYPEFEEEIKNATFILTAEPPTRIAEWEKGEADGSTWTMLRVPFLLLLVLVAAFLARTGGEGVQAMAAIVSAVFAGLPILIQALSFLRGGQTGKLTAE